MLYRFPIPANEEDFELLCLELLRLEWSNPNLQRVGSRGEKQYGLDIFDPSGESPDRAAQCRLKAAHKTLPPQEIRDEVQAVDDSGRAGLSELAFYTTGKRSEPCQRFVERLNAERRAKDQFIVAVHTWPEIEELLRKHTGVARQFYPELFGQRAKHGLYGVPRQQPGFVGREEDLERVKSAILEGNTAVTASITGLAGIGKTALATELANRLALEGHFPGGLIWLEAESGDLTAGWAKDEVGGRLAAGIEPRDRVATAVNSVSDLGESVLIVLDNVVDWTTSKHPKPLPQGSHVHLLMTTREAGLGGNDFQQIPLDVLEPAEARELLRVTAGRDIEPGVDDLLGALEGHALALELAGAFLNEEGTAQEYLEAADFEPFEAEVSARVRYERTTSSALAAVWKKLDEEARAAWCVAAQFEPESVGRAISEAAGVSAKSRRTLLRYHLIKNEGDAGEEARWRMHRLVGAFGRNDARGSHLVEARERYVTGLRSYVGSIDLALGYSLYRPERVHLDAQAEQLLAGDADAEDSVFFDRVATGRLSAGEFESATELYDAACEIDRRVLGEEHPDTLTSMNNLAGTLRAQGELGEARKLQERVLEVRGRELGEEHPDTLTSMSNLAGTLWAQGELGEARKLQEQVVEVMRRVLGEEHPSTLTSMGNLAATLCTQGEVGEARKLQEQVLEVTRRVLGEEHPSTLTSMNNLAGPLRAQGELGEARKLEEQVLGVRGRVLGEEHPSTLTSMNNLASTLWAQGEVGEARKLQEQVLEVRGRVLGEEHPSTLTSMNNLARMFAEQGDRSRARQLVAQALSGAKKTWGDEHPNTKSLAAFLEQLES